MARQCNDLVSDQLCFFSVCVDLENFPDMGRVYELLWYFFLLP